MKIDRESINSQVLYFSHGGGPLPLLNDPSHEKMIEFMKNLPTHLKRPDAIVVISAHWEESVFTIQSGEAPDMMYDYYGFPKEAYSIKYPCKGNPELSHKIAQLFSENGIEYIENDKRAYDHGSYIPLKMMYPESDIPVLQISLNHNLDPLTHIKMGKALRTLLNENILFIGSGFSFHNMRAFDFNGEIVRDPLNDSFQDKLIEVCCNEENEEDRIASLISWKDFPNARYAHPREEHLLPLLVCAGLSETVGSKIFDDYILGKRALAFLWK